MRVPSLSQDSRFVRFGLHGLISFGEIATWAKQSCTFRCFVSNEVDEDVLQASLCLFQILNQGSKKAVYDHGDYRYGSCNDDC